MFAAGEIISHQAMSFFERISLQAGMNFRAPPDVSIFLMSTRTGAPYNDRVEDGGRTLIYEGHDVRRNLDAREPKMVDQVLQSRTGKRTQNGKFHDSAQRHKIEGADASLIRVYQKLRSGIWVFNGTFRLVDSWPETDGSRTVHKFKLELTEDVIAEASQSSSSHDHEMPQTRMIPSDVKRLVYQRDGGQCVICGADDNLHFDHELPYSKGGTSLVAENIRILCARHNLSKGAKIQ